MKKLLTAILIYFSFIVFGSNSPKEERDGSRARRYILAHPKKTLNTGCHVEENFCMVPLQAKWLPVIGEFLGKNAARLCNESRFSWVVISRYSGMLADNVSGVVGIKGCKGRQGTLQISGDGDFNPHIETGIISFLHMRFPNAQWYSTAMPGSEDEKDLLYRGFEKISGNIQPGQEENYLRFSTKELEAEEKVTFFPYGRGRKVPMKDLDKRR